MTNLPNMSSRVNEIRFSNDYSKQDFLDDCEAYDLLLELAPETERKQAQNDIIAIINNKSWSLEQKQGAVSAQLFSYATPENISKLPKRKVLRLMAIQGKLGMKEKVKGFRNRVKKLGRK